MQCTLSKLCTTELVLRGRPHSAFRAEGNLKSPPPPPPAVKTPASRITRRQSWQVERGHLCLFCGRSATPLPLPSPSYMPGEPQLCVPAWERLWEAWRRLLCYFNICRHYNFKSSHSLYNPVTRSPKSSLNGRAVKHSGKSGTLGQIFRWAKSLRRPSNPHNLPPVNLRESTSRY